MIISISIVIVIRMSIMSRESSSSSSSFVSDYEYPALCIPRALGKITQDELHSIIKSSGLGEISKIVMKPKEFVLPRWEQTTPAADTATADTADTATAVRQTVSYSNVYIYFKKWNTHDPRVRKYRDNVMNGQTIKIVHNAIPTPIFWRCVAANFTPSRNKINKIDI